MIRILVTDEADDERWQIECRWCSAFQASVARTLAQAASDARAHAVATQHLVEITATREAA